MDKCLHKALSKHKCTIPTVSKKKPTLSPKQHARHMRDINKFSKLRYFLNS